MPNDQEPNEGLFLAEGKERIEWREKIDGDWTADLAAETQEEMDRIFAPFSERAVIVLAAWSEGKFPLTAAARAGLGVEKVADWARDVKFRAALRFAQWVGLDRHRARVFGATRRRDMFHQVTDDIIDRYNEFP